MRPISRAGKRSRRSWRSVRNRLEARKQSRPADFTKWLAAADPKALDGDDPDRRPAAGGDRTRRPRDGRSPARRFESADAGDFEKDHAFSFGAWIKVPKPGLFGSVIARMDDRSNYRGWDMWLEGGRIATHLVHQWPEDALKVVSRGEVSPGVWTHVFVTYDGSARAAGVKIYINGEPQETDVQRRQL